MPIIQSSTDFDFTNSTVEEKKELITKLLNKQKELANFLIQTYPTDIDLRIHLMFITMICSTTFGECFCNFIPNQVLSEDEFASLFASKLDDYLSQQAQNETVSEKSFF